MMGLGTHLLSRDQGIIQCLEMMGLIVVFLRDKGIIQCQEMMGSIMVFLRLGSQRFGGGLRCLCRR